jgi:plastocyanin
MEVSMNAMRFARFRRWAPILGAAALWVSLGAAGLTAAEHVVHVGQGGMKFVDETSGTNVSTINAGDTVTWVWEADMNHGVTAGVCPPGGGGGGGGYVVMPGYGGGDCTPSNTWESAVQATGSYSHTFTTAGTFTYYCPVHLGAMTGKVIVQPAAAAGPCVPDTQTLCLNEGRFSVTADWEKPDGSSGHGNSIPLTDDSGYFWFFDSANIEAVVKVLNGCAITNAYWVFAAGLTNVAVHVTVTDNQTGAVYTRDNAQGSAFQPIQDTKAFPTSCP